MFYTHLLSYHCTSVHCSPGALAVFCPCHAQLLPASELLILLSPEPGTHPHPSLQDFSPCSSQLSLLLPWWWWWFSRSKSSASPGQVQVQAEVTSVMSNSCDTVDCSPQAPLSMGFPRQEYWSVLPFPSPGGLPDPGISCRQALHWLPSSPPPAMPPKAHPLSCRPSSQSPVWLIALDSTCHHVMWFIWKHVCLCSV